MDKTSSSRSRSRDQSRNRQTQQAETSSEEEEVEQIECPHFEFKRGEMFHQAYVAEQHLADGTFGRVIRVRSVTTKERYAMKIIKAEKRHIENAQTEVEILQRIHDHEKPHKGAEKIVSIVEGFHHKQNFCIVFEELGKSIYDTLKQNDYRGFPMGIVKEILRDTLIGLEYIHSLGLTHTDLKPENILFTSMETFKVGPISMPKSASVKIVDFGGATFDDEHHSTIINTRQYRAPEVILNCMRWDQQSDLWGLGCIALEMMGGEMFFSTRRDDYEHLAMIEKTCGEIPAHMVLQIKNECAQYFDRAQAKIGKKRSFLKWPFGAKRENIQRVNDMKHINDIIPKKFTHFIELVKKMLVVDPAKRITAKAALRHPFFTANG